MSNYKYNMGYKENVQVPLNDSNPGFPEEIPFKKNE